MTNRNGTVHKGCWLNGRKEGEGCETYINGDCYKGEWKNDEFHGKGIFTYDRGRQLADGIWKRGSFLKGTWKGESYVG